MFIKSKPLNKNGSHILYLHFEDNAFIMSANNWCSGYLRDWTCTEVLNYFNSFQSEWTIQEY